MEFTLFFLEKIDSTSSEALRRLKNGARHGTVIHAARQTKGRGQHGRLWVSEPGNLYFSIILRPQAPLKHSHQLSFVGCVALGKTLEALKPTDLSYKWPNDLLIQGRKIGGILCDVDLNPDQTLNGAVLGIGLNIAHYPEMTRTPATCLNDIMQGGAPKPEELLNAFLKNFSHTYSTWLDQGFEPIRESWLNKAHPPGTPLHTITPHGPIEGNFFSLSKDGALLLKDKADNTVEIRSGEIRCAEPIHG